MLDILDAYMRIEVMSIAHISLIKDLTNSVLAQSAQVPPVMILVYFKGPSTQIEHFDYLDIDVDIDMGEHRDTPQVTTEGADNFYFNVSLQF